jgi:hypothetical protein
VYEAKIQRREERKSVTAVLDIISSPVSPFLIPALIIGPLDMLPVFFMDLSDEANLNVVLDCRWLGIIYPRVRGKSLTVNRHRGTNRVESQMRLAGNQ